MLNINIDLIMYNLFAMMFSRTEESVQLAAAELLQDTPADGGAQTLHMWGTSSRLLVLGPKWFASADGADAACCLFHHALTQRTQPLFFRPTELIIRSPRRICLFFSFFFSLRLQHSLHTSSVVVVFVVVAPAHDVNR